MKLRAILARTTTDKIKSRILSKDVAELVFECYMTPNEFAQLVSDSFENELELDVNSQS